MLCRNRMKASPKYKNLFKNHGATTTGEPVTISPEVAKIREQLGDFAFNGAIDKNLVRLILEKRPAKILADGSQYEGQWVVGSQTRAGKGLLTWPDGSIYEGWWLNNKAHGKGRLIHVDGSMYQGQWKDDNCDGYGVYYHLNGTKYDGEWLENEQHG